MYWNTENVRHVRHSNRPDGPRIVRAQGWDPGGELVQWEYVRDDLRKSQRGIYQARGKDGNWYYHSAEGRRVRCGKFNDRSIGELFGREKICVCGANLDYLFDDTVTAALLYAEADLAQSPDAQSPEIGEVYDGPTVEFEDAENTGDFEGIDDVITDSPKWATAASDDERRKVHPDIFKNPTPEQLRVELEQGGAMFGRPEARRRTASPENWYDPDFVSWTYMPPNELDDLPEDDLLALEKAWMEDRDNNPPVDAMDLEDLLEMESSRRTAAPKWLSELAGRAARSETADVDHQIVEELASKPLTGDESVDYWINSAQISKADGTDYDIVQALSRLAGRRTAAAEQWREVETGLWRFEDDQFMASVTAPWPGEEAWSWTVETLSRQQIRGGQAYGKNMAISAAEDVMNAHRTSAVLVVHSRMDIDQDSQREFASMKAAQQYVEAELSRLRREAGKLDIRGPRKHRADITLVDYDGHEMWGMFALVDRSRTATVRTADNGEGPFVGSIRDRQKQLGFNAICRDCRWIGRHWGTVQEAKFDADMHATIKHDDDDWQYRQETLSSGQLDRLSTEFRTSSRRTAGWGVDPDNPTSEQYVNGQFTATILERATDVAVVYTEDGGLVRVDGKAYDTYASLEEAKYGAQTTVDDWVRESGGYPVTEAQRTAGKTAAMSLWDQIAEPRHKVAGWDWDDHLAGYVAEGAADFACICGSNVSAPGHTACSCGKKWNSYEIRAADGTVKLVAREVPVRDGVLLASTNVEQTVELHHDSMASDPE